MNAGETGIRKEGVGETLRGDEEKTTERFREGNRKVRRMIDEERGDDKGRAEKR